MSSAKASKEAAGRPKRKVMEDDDDSAASKAAKNNPGERFVLVPDTDKLLDEYMCSISQKLPVDPVLADDGRVYDRQHLLDWFVRNPGSKCKSPLTGVEMGKKLVPATQIKNTLTFLIEKGIVYNEDTVEWAKACKEIEGQTPEFKEHLTKACMGEVESMVQVGNAYRDANGVKRHEIEAFKWYAKASAKGNPRAACSLGVLYVNGTRDDKSRPADFTRGLLELARAGALGSEHACLLMGTWFSTGLNGLVRDDAAARWWYQESLNCRAKDGAEANKDKRDKWLAEHP